MFNPYVFENSGSSGHGVFQIVEPTIGINEPRPRFVPLKATHVSGSIAGPLASLKLRQTFEYTRHDCGDVLEAIYRFPLSGDAAITGVLVRFGDVEIVTILKERDEAEADYAAAKESGQQAMLLSRESANVFTLQVAGLRPDEPVAIETSFVQLANADGLGWTLRVPLTTAPRFVREDELGSAFAKGQPLALLRDPGYRFSLVVSVDGNMTVDSPTHELVFVQETDRTLVQLAGGSVIPDRDCVLAWQPAQTAEETVEKISMTIFCHDDVDAGLVYFLALVEPPLAADARPPLSREVLLLVDHSGSMAGPKWAAADWAVDRFLSDLFPGDAFALAVFHTNTEWYSRKLAAAEPEAVDQAVQWFKSNRDSGGTNLGVALEEALHITPKSGTPEAGAPARNVLIVTDAQVSDQGRLLRLADQESAKVDGRRINILCIDAAPNSYLANQLAERGGGIAKFLTSSPKEIDITTALDQVLAIWGEPVLTNLRLTVNRSQIESAGQRMVAVSDDRQPEKQAIDVGDLVSGQSRWIAGRAPRGEGGPIEIVLQSAQGENITSAAIELADLPALKALFGARRINGLEHLMAAGYSGEELASQLQSLGYDPDAVDPLPEDGIYAETQRQQTQEALRHLLVAESLTYQLPSSVASFVAIRTEAGERVEGTVGIANALPAGWSDMFTQGEVPAFKGALRSGGPSALVASALPPLEAALSAPPMPAPSMMPMPAAAGSMGAGPLSGAVGAEWIVLYDGPVLCEDGTMVLYETDDPSAPDSGAPQPPAPTKITGIRMVLGEGAPNWRQIDRRVELFIYVGDSAQPRAVVRLADLLRHGERPLNLACGENQLVRIELRDPSGFFTARKDGLELGIRW